MDSYAFRIENVHYAYPPAVPGGPGTPALRGIDLEVERAAFVAIVGPTGAGKTTLCLALNGLVPQSTGGVFRGDVSVAGCKEKSSSAQRETKRSTTTQRQTEKALEE